MDKERVIVFGTGRASEHFIKADFNNNIFDLVAFADNNEQKQGTEFFGKRVLAPSEIKNYKYDSIIIASNFFEEISEELIEKHNISKEKMHSRHYREIEQIQMRYTRYYERNANQNKTEGEKKLQEDTPVVVYTAITGGFDSLREPEIVDSNFRYICYTDQEDLQSDVWEIRKIPIENNDYNRTAKKFKILPHRYFPEYEWSIWIDGQLQITGDLRELVSRYMRTSHLMCFLHQVRTCIHDEAEICKMLGHDAAEIVDNQMKRIMSTGYKDDNELIAGGFLVRRHNEADVKVLMEDWWEMIYEGSRRDQLSFNFVAWKNDFFFDITDLNIMDNQFFRRYSHKKIYKG